MTNSNHYFEQIINQVYDHLYANAPMRTPTGIATEAGKILRTITYIQKIGSIGELRSINIETIKSSSDAVVFSLSKKFRKYFQQMNNEWKIYSKNTEIKISDFDLIYVALKLSNITFEDHSKDLFGDAIEIFRSNWVKSHGGQFFTDQRVTKLAVSLLDFDPTKGDDFIDICAGTGGFLLAAFNKIKEITNSSKTENKLNDYISNIKGQEIDSDLCEIGNATFATKLGLPDIQIIQMGNSIMPFDNPSSQIKFNSHKCVATNPPFGSKITIKDNSILRNFELSQVGLSGSFIKSSRLTPRSPDTLFLEQNIKLLKPGEGRLAIVLPYQIVSGPQTQFIREWLLQKAEILAVIDLPSETFQPHTGTKASLVVVKRRKKELEKISTENDSKIFMARPRWIGHDRRGNPTYKKDADGSTTSQILSDFNEVENAYAEFKIGKDPKRIYNRCYVVNASMIMEDPSFRIDAQFYDPAKKKEEALPKTDGKIWKSVKISDVVKKIFYPIRFKRDYVERGKETVPFLGGTNISQFIINTDKRLSLDNPYLKHLTVEKGWILITRSGSVGIATSVPTAWDGYAASEHIIRIIPDPKKMPAEYLYLFLKTNFAKKALSRGIYGSVIDEITPDFIASLEVPIPEPKKLREIVERVKNSEEHRDQAISGFTSSLFELENLLNS